MGRGEEKGFKIRNCPRWGSFFEFFLVIYVYNGMDRFAQVDWQVC